MKRQSFLLSGLAAVCLPLAAMAAQDTWINNGTIATPPTIDATNVINNGVIGPIGTIFPFDTSNTRNFTNTGTMSGGIGFRFDTAPRNSSGQLIGVRNLSANFHNRNSGVISALDSRTLGGFAGSVFYVQSTNIINQGILTVGAGGLMQLTGTNVNLSRGGFGVQPIGNDPFFLGSFNDNPSVGIFTPDIAIADNYWEQTNITFDVSSFLAGNGTVSTPTHGVQTANGGFLTGLNLGSYYSDAISNVVRFIGVTATNIDGSITNFQVPTNVVMQAAFVAVPNVANVSVGITFVPSSQFT